MNKLKLDKKNGLLLGVCAGFAKYFKADVSLIRILLVTFTWFYIFGLFAYIAAAIILPDE